MLRRHGPRPITEDALPGPSAWGRCLTPALERLEAAAEPRREPAAECEPFGAIESDEFTQPGRRQYQALRTLQRLRAHEGARLFTHLRDVGVGHGAPITRDAADRVHSLVEAEPAVTSRG